jgi:RHS repeat-associated protein
MKALSNLVNSNIKNQVLAFLMLFSVFSNYSQNQVILGVGNQTGIYNGYLTPSDNAYIISNKSFIELGVQLNTAPFQVRTTIFKIRVTPRDVYGNSENFYDIELQVENNQIVEGGSYVDRVAHELQSFGVLVEVLEIHNFDESGNEILSELNINPGNIYLKVWNQNDIAFSIDQNPYYGFTIQYNYSTDEVDFDWNNISHAIGYELEWTWVDNYDIDDQDIISASDIIFNEVDFKNNSSRISTENNFYSIPCVFDKGYLLARVRAIGNFSDPEYFDRTLLAKWNNEDINKEFVSDWDFIQIVEEHESQNPKNWQFQASYAEQGKKKEVISYFDGTLRNRQTVTKINSNDKVIAGETLYDLQGRPAIEILPVPLQTNVLKYNPNISLSNTHLGDPFNFRDFDIDSNSQDCTAFVGSLLNTEGASKYYSENNNYSNTFQDYVPDAQGYPFSQTEFTPDNTGRIKRKGGVGIQYQLESGHEMKYFYTTPFAEELQRLFGNESVGNFQHYKKNIVIDPNHQASISYIDPQGRTIATALKGDSPDSMISLIDNSETNINTFNYSIINNRETSYFAPHSIQDALVTTREIINLKEGTQYDFNYLIETIPTSFTLSCDPAVSYDFKYNLKFNVKNSCGESVLQPSDTLAINLIGNNYTKEFSATLNEGSYTVSKELVVDETTMNEYADEYILSLQDPNSDCFVDPNNFLPDVSLDGCVDFCHTCLVGLGLDMVFYRNYTYNGDQVNEVYNSTNVYKIEQSEFVIEFLEDHFQDTIEFSYVGNELTWTYNANIPPVNEFTIEEQELIAINLFNSGITYHYTNQDALNALQQYILTGLSENYLDGDSSLISLITLADTFIFQYAPYSDEELTTIRSSINYSTLTSILNPEEYSYVAYVIDALVQEFQESVQNCESGCTSFSLTFDSCSINRGLMLQDVSPMGQYGSDVVDENEDGEEVVLDRLSVFNEENELPIYDEMDVFGNLDEGENNWRHPFTLYSESNGQESFVQLLVKIDIVTGLKVMIPEVLPNTQIKDAQNNTFTYTNADLLDLGYYYASPQDLKNISDFLLEWKDSWAESLLPYHPEYPYYYYSEIICQHKKEVRVYDFFNITHFDQHLNSDEFDSYLRQIDSFQNALDAGLLDPNDDDGLVVSPPETIDNTYRLMTLDPYFDSVLLDSLNYLAGMGNDDFTNQQRIMKYAMNKRYEGLKKRKNKLDLLEAAYFNVMSNGITGYNIPFENYKDTNLLEYLVSTDDIPKSQKNKIWKTYREYYLNLKEKIKYVFLNDFAQNVRAYNGCIGVDPGHFYNFTRVLSKSKSGIIVYNYPSSLIPNNEILQYPSLGLGNFFNIPQINPNIYSICINNDDWDFKQKRFIHLDFLNNTSTQEAIDAFGQQAQYNNYTQSGLCPLAWDLEAFLDGLVNDFQSSNDGNLLNITSLNPDNNTYLGQYLTSDLFNALSDTDIVFPEPDELDFQNDEEDDEDDNDVEDEVFSNEDFIQTNVTYVNYVSDIDDVNSKILHLSFSAQNALNESISFCGGESAITLKLPDVGGGSTLFWENYGTSDTSNWFISHFSQFYYDGYIENSDNSITFKFKILADVLNGGSSMQVVFEGTTCAAVGDCTMNGDDPENPALVGIVDDLGFGGPLNMVPCDTCTSDSDADGINNCNDNCPFVYNPDQLDQDYDGIGDTCENALPDCDSDGIPDIYDLDDDNDGLLDETELLLDTNICNVDTDGDGIVDALEDPDQDGISNNHEEGNDPNQPLDTDGDGIIDALDTDSDNDGILDIDEGTGDCDLDGIENFIDNDPCPNACNLNCEEAIIEMMNFMLSSENGNHFFDSEYNLTGNGYLFETCIDDFFDFNTNQEIIWNNYNNDNYIELTVDGNTVFQLSFYSSFIGINEFYSLNYNSITGYYLVFENSFGIQKSGFRDLISCLNNNEFLRITSRNVLPILSQYSCDCIPVPVEPVSCSDKLYTLMDALGILDNNGQFPLVSGLSDEVPTNIDGYFFPAYYFYDDPNTEFNDGLQNFCNMNWAYAVDDYITYINAILGDDVGSDDRSIENPYFITISTFSSSYLGMGFVDMDIIINEYSLYINHPNIANETILGWVDFVTYFYKPNGQLTDFEGSAFISPYMSIHSKVCPPEYLPPLQTVYATVPDPCAEMADNVANINMSDAYQAFLNQMREEFKEAYTMAALQAVQEQFNMEYEEIDEYQYTLYYYDQAGNLVQTVPPQGVDRLTETELESGLQPNHTLKTQYRYNSLNQLVWQSTPDGGITKFAYDYLGRIIASQNDKQKSPDSNDGSLAMSYTNYDGLGRVYEAGEVHLNGNTYEIDDIGRLFDTSLNQVNGFENVLYKKDISYTIYDYLPENISPINQLNLKNRVGAVFHLGQTGNSIILEDIINGKYLNAIFYSYDIHGNVFKMATKINNLNLPEVHKVKITDYEYDLISGNVNRVVYQKGEKDQFMHRYEYDADNRIVSVQTSRDGVIWERDAAYQYYEHGPLAKVIIGEKEVQGLDYAYTLQGWLKGVNSEVLSPSKDIGKDGFNGNFVAKDAFGFSLNYFNGDYQSRIHERGENSFSITYSGNNENSRNLYNGNIKTMITLLTDLRQNPLAISQNNYSYDQLNRIKRMQAHLLDPLSTSTIGNYSTAYDYDRNGNLLHLDREVWRDNFALRMDGLDYYYTNNNQLRIVGDRQGDASRFVEDIDDQFTQMNINPSNFNINNTANHNYIYDEIGQLIEDKTENLKIEWTVSGKVSSVSKPSSIIFFEYDALGNRIAKRENSLVSRTNKSTYYFRDAQGNVLSTYDLESKGKFKYFYLDEQDIYGSSRLGVQTLRELLYTNEKVEVRELIDGVKVEEYEDKELMEASEGLLLNENHKIIWNDPDVNLNFHNGNHIYTSTNFRILKPVEVDTTFTLLQLERLDPINPDIKYHFSIDFRYNQGLYYPDIVLLKQQEEGNYYKTIYQSQEGFKDMDYKIFLNIGIDSLEISKCEIVLNVNDRTLYPEKGLDVLNFSGVYSGSHSMVINEMKSVPIVNVFDMSYEIDKKRREFYFKNSLEKQFSLDQEVSLSYLRPIDPELIFLLETANYENAVGDKNYELSNHLGNVLEVITDRKIINVENRGIPLLSVHFDNGMGILPFAVTEGIDSYDTEKEGLVLYTKQSAQGVETEVSMQQDNTYLLAFEARKDDFKGLLECVLLDDEGKIQWKEVFEKSDKYFYTIKGIPTGNYNLAIRSYEGEGTFVLDDIELLDITYSRPIIEYNYLNFLTDQSIFVPDVISYNDYYPFGMLIPGRHEASGSYRYGFQGQEKDDEIKGEGNSLNYTFRMYDSRIGRWLSRDSYEKKFTDQSPYNFVYNDVIRKKDINGQYGSDGHFWTVYALGLAMGLSNETALGLAKKAEYYDNIVHGNKINDISFETNMSGSVMGIPTPTWADPDFQGLYHGLNGKLSEDVKKDAINGINGGNLNDLHLYGDAHAHATASSGYKKMYGNCQGCFTIQHAFGTKDGEGKFADDISKHSKQYLKYVDGLTGILKDLHPESLNTETQLFNLVSNSGLDEIGRTNILKSYIASETNQSYTFKYSDISASILRKLDISYIQSTKEEWDESDDPQKVEVLYITVTQNTKK